MAFTTSKLFRFSAAHALDHLGEGRRCAQMHGHNYTVEVIFEASMLSPDSFVRDPIDYRIIEQFIRRTLDRKDLNEVFAAEFEEDLKGHLARRSVRDVHEWIMPSDADLEVALRTTTENIARALFLRLKSDFRQIVAVKVHDNYDTWAEYREDHDDR
jgi:6-pyruvoyltetrahydropterin/6-carboxytetrahydropterin synthase